jgi:hypothetical protein
MSGNDSSFALVASFSDFSIESDAKIHVRMFSYAIICYRMFLRTLSYPSAPFRTPPHSNIRHHTLSTASVLFRTPPHHMTSFRTLRTLFDFKTFFPRWNDGWMKEKEKGYKAELWQVVSYPRRCQSPLYDQVSSQHLFLHLGTTLQPFRSIRQFDSGRAQFIVTTIHLGEYIYFIFIIPLEPPYLYTKVPLPPEDIRLSVYVTPVYRCITHCGVSEAHQTCALSFPVPPVLLRPPFHTDVAH